MKKKDELVTKIYEQIRKRKQMETVISYRFDEQGRKQLAGEFKTGKLDEIVRKRPELVKKSPVLSCLYNDNGSYKDPTKLLSELDKVGICASSGSACNTGVQAPSHVLTAIGLSDDIIRSSLRFTIGYSNTEEDIDYVLDILSMEVKKLRE